MAIDPGIPQWAVDVAVMGLGVAFFMAVIGLLFGFGDAFPDDPPDRRPPRRR